MFVLHELASFFIEGSIENPKGVVAVGCLLRGEGVGCKVDVMKDGFLCEGVPFATGVEGDALVKLLTLGGCALGFCVLVPWKSSMESSLLLSLS